MVAGDVHGTVCQGDHIHGDVHYHRLAFYSIGNILSDYNLFSKIIYSTFANNEDRTKYDLRDQCWSPG